MFIKRLVAAQDKTDNSGNSENILSTVMREYHNNNTARVIDLTSRLTEILRENNIIGLEDVGDIDRNSTALEIVDKVLRILGRAKDNLNSNAQKEASVIKTEIGKRLENIEADSIVSSIIILGKKVERENKKLVIPLDTDWIPRDIYEENGFKALLQEIEKLPETLRTMGVNNVELIHKMEKESLEDWFLRVKNSLPDQTDMSNVVFIGSVSNIGILDKNEFQKIDKNKRPFLAKVDPKDIESFHSSGGVSLSSEQLYIQIVEILSMSLELCSGKLAANNRFAIDYCSLEVFYDYTNRMVLFLPKARKVDLNIIPNVYRAKLKALQSA